MENLGPLILDISSDEETGFGSESKGGEYDIGKGELTEDDCFWLTRLLDEVDGSKDDGTDDVVVVSEVFPKPRKKSRVESLKPSRKVGESNDDDDCMVLDGDPDKPVVVVNARVKGNEDEGNDSGKDSDDIQIVGQKGEVACRDFPHARHLCGKFVFASTPHEIRCSQCHCYVCDCLAPCSYWGTGISIVDHCHANDKEEYWRAERKRMKKGGKPTPIIPTASDTSILKEIFETPRVPDPLQYNSFPLNQGLSSVSLRPYSLLSSASVPTVVDQGRIHSTGHVPMHWPQTGLVSLQSHPTNDSSVPSRDGSNNTGSRSAQSFTPHGVSKWPGVPGSFPNNRNASVSRLHRSANMRYHPFQTPSATGRHGSNPVNIVRHVGAAPVLPPPLSSLPGMAVGRINYVPPRQLHSRPYPSYPIRGPVQFQSRSPSQPYTPTVVGSAVQLQLELPSQPSVENLENFSSSQSRDAFQPNSPFQSPILASLPSDEVSAFGDQLHSGSLISSPSSVGKDFETQPSQQQAHFSRTSSVSDDHNYIHQGNSTCKDLVATPAEFGINHVSSFGSGSKEIVAEVSQCQATAPDVSSQLQYLTKGNDHRLGQAVDYSHPPGSVLADNSSQINGTYSHFPESTKSELNFNLDYCMFENDRFPGAFDVPLSPGWTEFSPDPASVGIDTALGSMQNGALHGYDRLAQGL